MKDGNGLLRDRSFSPNGREAMRLNDWTLWASAQAVIKRCGANAPEYAAAQVLEAEAAGDDVSARAWREIAERIDQLMDYRTGRPLSRH